MQTSVQIERAKVLHTFTCVAPWVLEWASLLEVFGVYVLNKVITVQLGFKSLFYSFAPNQLFRAGFVDLFFDSLRLQNEQGLYSNSQSREGEIPRIT